MTNYYIGNTDFEWFDFLRKLNPEDINFWQPSGLNAFRAISKGAPFLLKLKNPVNKIAGVGFFSSHSILPIRFVWDVFGIKNGVNNYIDFYNKINSYRKKENTIEKNPNIGCIVLTNPVFFDEKDWIPLPADWKKNIVKGKTYSIYDETGRKYWQKIEFLLFRHIPAAFSDRVQEDIQDYSYTLSKVRIGQGAFRILITDAYERRCAVTGEKTLPVLEAAHIKPFSVYSDNSINNGLLLRSDLHKLFDDGYITITSTYNVEVSKRIKEEYENGREYYKLHGSSLISLPRNRKEWPDPLHLDWHNTNVYK